jgi:hypothetical protein
MKAGSESQGRGLEMRSLDIPLYQKGGRRRRRWSAQGKLVFSAAIAVVVVVSGYVATKTGKQGEECSRQAHESRTTSGSDAGKQASAQVPDCPGESRR